MQKPRNEGRFFRAVWSLLALTAAGCSIAPQDVAVEPAPPPPPVETDLESRVVAWKGGVTTILAADGTRLGEFSLERCSPLPPARIPQHLINAFLAAEEPGVCSPGNPGSMGPLLAALEETSRNGSSLEAIAERCTAIRAAMAGDGTATPSWLPLENGEWLRLDDAAAIRSAYLNLVDFGAGDFGIEAGARSLFGKSASDVSLSQAALMAVVATRPEARGSSEALRKARNALLRRMESLGLAEPLEVVLAQAAGIPRRKEHRDPAGSVPPYLSGVKVELWETMAGRPEFRRGLTVHTPYDPKLEKVGGKAIERVLRVWKKNREKEAKKLAELLENLGPEAAEQPPVDLPPGARLEVPDDSPSVAVFSMEPYTGRVRLIMDVFDEKDRYSRGIQKRKRQPGSAWKPFLYASALEQGMTQADAFTDKAFVYRVKDEEWAPKNHEEKYYGWVTARLALAHSLNSVAIQLIFNVKPEKVVGLATRLGIGSRIRPVPALALGTSPVLLPELVSAYTVFASQGQRVAPRFVDYVEDDAGRPVAMPERPDNPQVMDPRVAYVMTDMLREVAKSGTAWPARKLGFPVAGKTGTTNESKDAWFMGYSSRLVTGVWVGYDNGDPLGGHETGGSLALPIWMEVMSTAAKSSAEPWGEFAIPPGVVFEVRSPWNGRPWETGKNMAFVAPARKSRYERPPEDAMPVEKLKPSKKAARAADVEQGQARAAGADEGQARAQDLSSDLMIR